MIFGKSLLILSYDSCVSGRNWTQIQDLETECELKRFNAEVFPKMQNNDRPGSTKPKFMIFPGKHRKGRHTATRQGTRGDPDNKYTQYDNGR